MESQQSETGLEDWDAWDTIIVETCDQLPEINASIQTSQDLLKEPHVNVFLETLFDQLTERLQFSHHIESENELFNKLQQTANKFLESDQGYNNSEALKKAWQERKILVIDMLLEHEKTINKKLFDDSSSSSSDSSPSDNSTSDSDPHASGMQAYQDMLARNRRL